jgi:hypothetical protein
VVVFLDTDIDKNYLDQPVQTQDAVDQLYMSEKTVLRTHCKFEWQTWDKQYKSMFYESFMLPSNRKDFYNLSARKRYTKCRKSSGGCKDDFTWYTKPGWLASVTGNRAKQYGLVLGQTALFTDHCTEGRSTKNVGGVWTMCGDDFTRLLNTTVPRPPSCDDIISNPACTDLPDLPDLPDLLPLLNYTADSDTDGNMSWENQTYITGYDWNLFSPTVRVTGVSALPGILTAYEFYGGQPGYTASASDLPGDPTDASASFEVWFKPSDLSGDEIVFEVGGNSNGMSLALSGSTLLVTWGSNGVDTQQKRQLSSTEEFIQAIAVIEFGAGENAPTTLSLYVDGWLVAQVNRWGMLAWGEGKLSAVGGWEDEIGGNNKGKLNGFGNFAGQIAIVRLYDHALTVQEVAQLYTRIERGW